MPQFDRVAIVGVGLLGASLGLALKQRRLAAHVDGIGRREHSLRKAIEIGAVDGTSLDLATAVRSADVVVLATPAAMAIAQLAVVRDNAPPHAIVTDVASTKAALCAEAARLWPAPRTFVGSHPMAGSEKYGPEHADPYLFDGSVCLVEEAPGIDPAAHALVRSLWQSVGARVVPIDPEAHDAILARTSHLPHVTAAALALVAGRQGGVGAFAGGGFRDTTRIAEGRPELWRDICLTNRAALIGAMNEMHGELDAFRAALEAGDAAALEAFFDRGVAARRAVLGE